MLLPKIVLVALVALGSNAIAPNVKSSGNETRKGQTMAPGSVTINWSNQKVATIRTFLRPSPDQYMEAIDANNQILRATVLLGHSTTVEFYERPKSIDFYDSTIVVNHQGQPPRSYRVGALIKHQALSLAHVGIVPYGNGTGMLVCEYEGGAVGAREGFAILRYTSAGFNLHTLPLTTFGKVVVFKSNPAKAEIWSALPNDVGADAEARYYAAQTCLWYSDGYKCNARKRKLGRFGPAAIDQPGIEIRP